ncbi:double-strand break repair protein AddB [Phaeovulum vinaykumarii]|uniref:ATP-dependent helicase/nuclease subunit B n=1 Tax=Phaeovulum vinaykumarii TaxID=407234 RepID=A0A1N7K984_9RHOB|nr:double-strand break repair protein AddB [Phaeovulum vinaykumarii]SIS58151.1 ATP-dependent helicase/nuclease subunit B [Phaeovulum vinaykumarii]SOB93698.1 ATP-dependent helicase/nuclease subunit B [Phaeovulum vinaykumarii]
MDNGLFALPPGADFAARFADGLIARMAGQPPEAMARVRIFANAGRMRREIAAALSARLGDGYLPRLGLVTDLADWPLPGIVPAVPALRRELELAALIADMDRRLPDFAPGSGLFALARSLARLMAEMHDEGVPPEAFERLEIAESHAIHWQRSLAFVRLVARFFDPEAAPVPAARARAVLDALRARWTQAPPQGPMIVVGSTGSRGTTAGFLRLVAGLPQGAVVLPGFDFEMPAALWADLAAGPVPAEDHPQYRAAALLSEMGLGPEAVRPWAPAPEVSRARNRLVSLALRPAPVTDRWRAEGAGLHDLPEGAAGLSLIEAPDPRHEALAIALALRGALAEGRRAALVTPDRVLARRVTAALDRWGLRPDDSAGLPLDLSPPGRLLRHVAGLMGRPLEPEPLLILLKHPLTATGADMRGPHLRLTRELELWMRRRGVAFPAPATLAPWIARDPEVRAPWAAWFLDALAELETAAEASLADHIGLHLRVTEALAAGPGGDVAASGLWAREGGAETRAVLDALAAEADAAGVLAPRQYGDLLGGLLAEGRISAVAEVDPRIVIRGTLEARALSADLVVLGALNEGSWPAPPAPDPWLSRKMRLDLGLTLPERQVGLAAHDFQQAVAAPQVILSRALRDGDSECVPARWLNRLTNLMQGLPDQGGAAALEAMRARGQTWLARARALEAAEIAALPPAARQLAPRPKPCPPLAARPRELPVTTIARLIRDPYAVYAREVLRLRPLDPLRPEPDAGLRGEVLHRIVEMFLRARPETETAETAAARLMATAEEVLETDVAWALPRRLWLARLERLSAGFAADEAARAARGRPVVIEQGGGLDLPGLGFRLTARPDRIDLLNDGRAHVFDYKSGRVPSRKQIDTYDKQLPLTAGLVERGAFGALGVTEVAAVSHVALGGAGGETCHTLTPEELRETWEGLSRLIARYLAPDQGFTARRALMKDTDVSDYDHLSRLGEWEPSDLPRQEDVG